MVDSYVLTSEAIEEEGETMLEVRVGALNQLWLLALLLANHVSGVIHTLSVHHGF
jgi:hypothetical protein